MRIFDPHIHMTSRTTDDYERMAAAGVRALVEPAFWLGQPRTSVETFADYFDSLSVGSRSGPASSASGTTARSR
jgi:predicted metal-dependent TIM-barrel fold hydrolase